MSILLLSRIIYCVLNISELPRNNASSALAQILTPFIYTAVSAPLYGQNNTQGKTGKFRLCLVLAILLGDFDWFCRYPRAVIDCDNQKGRSTQRLEKCNKLATTKHPAKIKAKTGD